MTGFTICLSLRSSSLDGLSPVVHQSQSIHKEDRIIVNCLVVPHFSYLSYWRHIKLVFNWGPTLPASSYTPTNCLLSAPPPSPFQLSKSTDTQNIIIIRYGRRDTAQLTSCDAHTVRMPCAADWLKPRLHLYTRALDLIPCDSFCKHVALQRRWESDKRSLDGCGFYPRSGISDWPSRFGPTDTAGSLNFNQTMDFWSHDSSLYWHSFRICIVNTMAS